MSLQPEAYVLLSAVLFAIGLAGAIVRRNALVVLLSIEIMLNSANLVLVAFSRQQMHHDGQISAVVAMAFAASEVVIGLGIVVALANLKRPLDTDELAELRG
jgi:NADH-quinone oxidoreductase subunit K